MKEFFPYLIFAAMAATVVVLVLGITNMARKDKNKNKRANTLMRWRVIAQAIALLLFSVFALAYQ